MTEDVINALSKFRWLFVIARGTMSTFKGKDVTTNQVAQTPGVRYVMEGSIRQAWQRIRVSAQVIDTDTGNHLWSERFDRQLHDIFVIQDEITNAISAAIAPEIDRAELRRAEKASPAEIDTWLVFCKASALLTEGDNLQTLAIAEQLIEEQPNFAPAYALAALAHAHFAMLGGSDDYDKLVGAAYDHALKALALDRRDSLSLFAASRACMVTGRFDESIAYGKEAIAANPNFAGGYYALGSAYAQSGQFHLAIEPLDRAISLSPLDALLPRILGLCALALFGMKQYQECAETAERALTLGMKTSWARAVLSIAYNRLGMVAKRDKALQALFEFRPGFSIAFVESSLPFVSQDMLDPLIAGLRELGVPEE
jgi:adenylate cyclase